MEADTSEHLAVPCNPLGHIIFCFVVENKCVSLGEMGVGGVTINTGSKNNEKLQSGFWFMAFRIHSHPSESYSCIHWTTHDCLIN